MLHGLGLFTKMKRRFLLRGSLTEGIPSVTGFPEGCGLSCIAMLLIDTAFHTWHRVFFPMCTPISYVGRLAVNLPKQYHAVWCQTMFGCFC